MQCLNIKKHAMHNIHRLAWAPMVMGRSGNCPAFPYVKTALIVALQIRYQSSVK